MTKFFTQPAVVMVVTNMRCAFAPNDVNLVFEAKGTDCNVFLNNFVTQTLFMTASALLRTAWQ